jgi:hypothetical protein
MYLRMLIQVGCVKLLPIEQNITTHGPFTEYTVKSLCSKLGRDHYYNERFLLSNGDVKNPWPPLIFFYIVQYVLFD